MGMFLKTCVAACCSAMMHVHAIADYGSLEVFGIAVGKQLNLPECSFKFTGSSKDKTYETYQNTMCFEEARKLNSYGVPVKRVVFPIKESPPYVKYWNVRVLEIEGLVAGFEFGTPGAEAQYVTLAALEKKFCKPTSIQKRALTNAFGAVFESISATWVAENYHVTFRGVDTKIDIGRVIIDSPSAHAMRMRWLEQERTAERSL